MPFLFGAGTPSANATFSGPFGPYHSSYDTLQFARTISDPPFDLHRAAAQLFGIAVLRLADADVVPYHFNAYVGPMNAALRNLAATARTRHVNIDTRGFDASIRRFAASANRHDAATKRVATGNLSAERLPDFPGLERFKGDWVQTSHWPHDRQVVTKGSCPHFGDRESPSGDHESRRVKHCRFGANHELRRALDLLDSGAEKHFHAGSLTFGCEHPHNVVCRSVAEKLA